MRLAAALAGMLLLAGCTTATPQDQSTGTESSQGSQRMSVDVDTPALRTAKKQAGIATCRPGGGSTQLPAVTLPCLGGGPDVALTGLRGPLVLNLFAEYCGPCRTELPLMQELHEKAGGRLSVLGVDYDDASPEGAVEIAAHAGVTYPLLADPTERLRVPFRVRGLPGTVFVRADGTVASVQLRVFRSWAELRTAVRQELGVTVPA